MIVIQLHPASAECHNNSLFTKSTFGLCCLCVVIWFTTRNPWCQIILNVKHSLHYWYRWVVQFLSIHVLLDFSLFFSGSQFLISWDQLLKSLIFCTLVCKSRGKHPDSKNISRIFWFKLYCGSWTLDLQKSYFYPRLLWRNISLFK